MICALVLSVMFASMPDAITLTAVLQERGMPLDRAVVMTLSLWSAHEAGDRTWNDDKRNVLVISGVLAVDVGAQRPLPLDAFTEQRWLEIVIDGQVLSPRVRIDSLPHAIEATAAARCAARRGRGTDGRTDTFELRSGRTRGTVANALHRDHRAFASVWLLVVRTSVR